MNYTKIKKEIEREDYVWEVPESVMYNSLAKGVDYNVLFKRID
jgi:hypothetical protein